MKWTLLKHKITGLSGCLNNQQMNFDMTWIHEIDFSINCLSSCFLSSDLLLTKSCFVWDLSFLSSNLSSHFRSILAWITSLFASSFLLFLYGVFVLFFSSSCCFFSSVLRSLFIFLVVHLILLSVSLSSFFVFKIFV